MNDDRETRQGRDGLEHGGEARRRPLLPPPPCSGMHEQQPIAPVPPVTDELAVRVFPERGRHADRRADCEVAGRRAHRVHEVVPHRLPRADRRSDDRAGHERGEPLHEGGFA